MSSTFDQSIKAEVKILNYFIGQQFFRQLKLNYFIGHQQKYYLPGRHLVQHYQGTIISPTNYDTERRDG